MKTLSGRGFKLPYVPNETFRELMRIGVGYRKEGRTYYIRNRSNVDGITALVSRILGEEVSFTEVSPTPETVPKICVICDRQLRCEDCGFAEECDLKGVESRPESREDGGGFCLCEGCLRDPAFFEKYVARGRELLGSSSR